MLRKIQGTEANPFETVDKACESIIAQGTKNMVWTIYIMGDVTGPHEGTNKAGARTYTKDFGRSIVTGFARLDAEAIGIIASNPAHLGGSLDIDSGEKAANAVALCTDAGVAGEIDILLDSSLSASHSADLMLISLETIENEEAE